jgi:hypothetical protein
MFHIGDYSRELYAGIYGDKSQFNSIGFLQYDVLAQIPYTIDVMCSQITAPNTKGLLNMLLLSFPSQ